MRKNKKHTRRLTASMLAPAGLLLCILIVGIAYRTLAIQIEDRSKDLKLLENKERVRNEQLQRETANWNTMKTPENLDAALRRCAMTFNTPAPSQIVHVHRDGRVSPSQAIADAHKRGKTASQVKTR